MEQDQDHNLLNSEEEIRGATDFNTPLNFEEVSDPDLCLIYCFM